MKRGNHCVYDTLENLSENHHLMVTMCLPCGILPMGKFVPKPTAPYCLTPTCTLNNNPLEARIPSMQHLWNNSLGARLEHVDLV